MISRRDFIRNVALGSTFILPSCRLLHDFTLKEDSNTIIPLTGDWYFRLDPENKGIVQKWYEARFVDVAKLPGSIQAQGYGNEVTAETEWWDGTLKGVWKTDPMYEKYRQAGNT